MTVQQSESLRVTPQDFYPAFGQNISMYLMGRIMERRMWHRRIVGQKQYDGAIRDMVAALQEDLPQSGPARHPVWEQGWAENLKSFKKKDAGLKAAMPHYFNKHPVVRWQGGLCVADSDTYEYDMLATIEDYIFDKYFRRVGTAYEFGCGTGHNLFRVRDVNKHCKLVGLDWAESAVKFITMQAMYKALDNLSAHRFDFFDPKYSFKLDFGCGVYTVAALEQVGSNFHPWLHYILEERPTVVAHIEPIEEVLDPNVLLDYLSLQYFKKRRYLTGYLRYLKLLEGAGKIRIHEVKRTGIGSKFIEGYTIIVWSPIGV